MAGWISIHALQDGILAADTMGRAKMADSFIQTAQVEALAVTGAKIAADTITGAKFTSKATYMGLYSYANAKYGDSTNTYAVYG